MYSARREATTAKRHAQCRAADQRGNRLEHRLARLAQAGAAAIANQVKNAWPGAIVLMHDGGGDRSQTVEALKDALPYLKSQGYRFVTMDELLGYPLS